MVLACHAFDDEMSAEVDATQGATAEEHHGDAASFVGKRELKARDLVSPRLYPERFDSTRNLDLFAPLHIGNRYNASKGTSPKVSELPSGLINALFFETLRAT
jgi:hypothetical protein